MISFFKGNAMWALVAQSDFVSKLVLLALMLVSMACWTVFFYKLILLRAKERQMYKAIAQIQGSKNIVDLEKVELAQALRNTLPGYMLDGYVSYTRALIGNAQVIAPVQWERIQENMEHQVDEVMHTEESYLSVLSTSAAVGPLLGLFGTVWGLVHAFISISEQQSADIATVAPGIAEALITTLAGLIVAVPALMMYNYLMVRMRGFERLVIKFCDGLSGIMRDMLA